MKLRDDILNVLSSYIRAEILNEYYKEDDFIIIFLKDDTRAKITIN